MVGPSNYLYLNGYQFNHRSELTMLTMTRSPVWFAFWSGYITLILYSLHSFCIILKCGFPFCLFFINRTPMTSLSWIAMTYHVMILWRFALSFKFSCIVVLHSIFSMTLFFLFSQVICSSCETEQDVSNVNYCDKKIINANVTEIYYWIHYLSPAISGSTILYQMWNVHGGVFLFYL